MQYSINSLKNEIQDIVEAEIEESLSYGFKSFIFQSQKGSRRKLCLLAFSMRTNKFQRNILHVALQEENIKLASDIINFTYKSSTRNKLLVKQVLNGRTKNGLTAVHLLSYLGETELLKKLLNHPEFDQKILFESVDNKFSSRISTINLLLTYSVDMEFCLGVDEINIFHLIPYLNTNTDEKSEKKVIKIFDMVFESLEALGREERNDLLTARTDDDEDLLNSCAYFQCLKLFLHLKEKKLLSLFNLNTVDSPIFYCLKTDCCENDECFKFKYKLTKEILKLDQFDVHTKFYGENLFGRFIDRLDYDHIEKVWSLFDLLLKTELSIWDEFREGKKTNAVEFLIDTLGVKSLELLDTSLKNIEPDWFQHISLGSSPIDFAITRYIENLSYTQDSILTEEDLLRASEFASFQNVKFLLQKGSQSNTVYKEKELSVSSFGEFHDETSHTNIHLLLLKYLLENLDAKHKLTQYHRPGSLPLAFSLLNSWNPVAFNLLLDNSDSEFFTQSERIYPCRSKYPHRLIVMKDSETSYYLKEDSWQQAYREVDCFEDLVFFCCLCPREIPTYENVVCCEETDCRLMYCEECLFSLNSRSEDKELNIFEYASKLISAKRIRAINKLLFFSSDFGKQILDSECDYKSKSSVFDIYQAVGLADIPRKLLSEKVESELGVFEFCE
eukprot:snap_masked-scaffold_6-processed-gene-3.33-mRNA-1 protein AED:1.00 eAED:1.00 QI:0/0/0/0/1/1/2/0/671